MEGANLGNPMAMFRKSRRPQRKSTSNGSTNLWLRTARLQDLNPTKPEQQIVMSKVTGTSYQFCFDHETADSFCCVVHSCSKDVFVWCLSALSNVRFMLDESKKESVAVMPKRAALMKVAKGSIRTNLRSPPHNCENQRHFWPPG